MHTCRPSLAAGHKPAFILLGQQHLEKGLATLDNNTRSDTPWAKSPGEFVRTESLSSSAFDLAPPQVHHICRHLTYVIDTS